MRIDLGRRVALIAGAPENNGGMIAEAQNLVADVGDVGGNVGGIGAIAGIGLEELVPHQDAVLVAELVEVFAGALAYPVANQVEMG